MSAADRLRQLDQAATPGPWKEHRSQDHGVHVLAPEAIPHMIGGEPLNRSVAIAEPAWSANAAVIATVRNALPAIADIIDWVYAVKRAAEVAPISQDALIEGATKVLARLEEQLGEAEE